MDGGGFDLADDSIFNEEDYNQMHRIVSDETAHEILLTLSDHGRISEDELADRINRPVSELLPLVRRLKRVGLIRKGIDPNTKPKKTYYHITEPGKTALDGNIQEIIQEENIINQQYSSEGGQRF